LVGNGTSSTRAKWRTPRSAWVSTPQKNLTSPTLLELAMFRQLRSGRQKVVRQSVVLDHNAVHVAPILLPSPSFLSARCISFDIRSRNVGRQGTLAMWTPWSRAFLEATTARARQEKWLHCCTNFLLSGAVRQPGHPFIPLGEDRGFTARIAIGVHRLRHPAVAQPILKTALTVFADTVAILSCHGSKILHDGGFECKDDLTSAE
jgi:hypothetical protein